MSRAYAVRGDWGTSNLRLFRIEDGVVVDRADGPGIGALAGPPADALLAALARWRGDGAPSQVALCGMVGSRNGLAEVPYALCPIDVAGWCAATTMVTIDGLAVRIAPGLACTNPAGAPDVMRGEETQIFGAIARDAALARGRHRIVLPGTHSKWALIEDGRIVQFQTFLTGELFALLRDHSTLTRAGTGSEGGDEGFAAGLARADQPGDLLGKLFEARSAQLRAGRAQGWALGFLSGLVIGHELRDVAPDGAVTLIGDPALASLYGKALAARGIAARVRDGDACALAGLELLPR